jgi:hypothetical protein
MSLNTVLSPPIPAYQNLPIEPQYYRPRQFFISAIALGLTTLVTTTVNHDYVIGQLTRLIIPNTFGSRELNEILGYVISIPAPNQVILDINSIGTTAFTASSATTQPQILAIGDVNSGAIGRHPPQLLTFIPGSFINISPF